MRFSRKAKLIVVRATLIGPDGRTTLRLAVDTGATMTMVPPQLLESVGYDLSMVTVRGRITTGSGVETPPRLMVGGVRALGEQRDNLVVIAHALPPSAGVDGVLGLDFFRDRELTIDFRNGLISLR